MLDRPLTISASYGLQFGEHLWMVQVRPYDMHQEMLSSLVVGVTTDKSRKVYGSNLTFKSTETTVRLLLDANKKRLKIWT
jgi:hypothetical protein